MERDYWILTTQQSGNFSSKTIWYEGNLTLFLLIEREQGRETNITFAKIIPKEEYELAMNELKRIKS